MIDKWTKYFLRQTNEIRSLSKDLSTKCGAILVKNNIPVSQGFNGPAKKLKDDLIPTERPMKYDWMFHAEDNCLLNYSGAIDDTYIMYISGKSCWKCLQRIYHVGIRNVYETNYSIPKMCNDQDEKLRQQFLSLCLDKMKIIYIDKKELD